MQLLLKYQFKLFHYQQIFIGYSTVTGLSYKFVTETQIGIKRNYGYAFHHQLF